jgi:hypothetical protein
MHGGAVQGEKLFHRVDALGVKAHLGARANTGQVAEFKVGDGAGELRGEKADEAVGLLHVAGDLGEVAIGCHADGTAKGFADVVADGLLDGEGDLARCGRVALAADELADHLVDGWGVGDGTDALDRRGYVVGELRVFGMGAIDEDDVGDEAFGFAYLGEGFDAEGLGFVAGGDERAGVGHGAADADGLAAVLGVKLLLYGRKEAVEIDVQEAEQVGLS